MNPWQLTKQIAYLLGPTKLVWADSPAAPVFGRVLITPVSERDVAVDARKPFCLIRPGSAAPDDEHDELIEEHRFHVAIYMTSSSDRGGEGSVTGRARKGVGYSEGRGVLELEDRVKAALRASFLGPRLRMGAAEDVEVASAGAVTAVRTLEIVATRLPSDPYYHPVRRQKKSGTTVSWALPPDRWDYLRVIVNRVSGSSAPANATAGTVVSSSSSATSVTDSPSAGTWTYGFWAAYDENGDGTADRYGPVATLTVVV